MFQEFDLKPILFPKTMAVIGLSRKNQNHPGNTTFLKNLMEMNVKTYGVSPFMQELSGEKIYSNISELPEVPDLAVYCVSAKKVKQSIIEAAEMGVKGGIIIGGGFAETGKEGKKLQDQIVKICEDYNMPFIGPNCVGVYSPPIVDTIFLPSERVVRPFKGNVAVISQSGGILMDQFFVSLKERNIGISSAISIGNKAMVKETHLLHFFETEPNTDVISFYLEGFGEGEGREFCKIAQKSKKDIVVYSGGKTESGKKAVSSHTASLGMNNRVMTSAFKQFSVVSAETELELKNFLKVYSMIANPYRRFSTMSISGDKVAILSVSGGHGVICADLLERHGLKLANFTKKQLEQMKFLMNPLASKIAGFGNPIDVTGAVIEEDIVNVLEYLLNQNNVGIIIMLLLPYPPQISMQLGREILKISNKYSKPIVTFVPWTAKYDLLRESLELNHIPCGHTVEDAVHMAKALYLKGIGGIRKKYS